MHYRARYKLSAIPFVFVTICLSALTSMKWGPLGGLLADQWARLPLLVIVVAAALPALFLGWYLFSYAEVRRSHFVVRSTFHVHYVDMKLLASASIKRAPAAGGLLGMLPRGEDGIVLWLEDEEGRQVCMPLDTWRDEDLLMARVLRATVDRRVRIGGDEQLLRRFGLLLDSYKSWDRQQAAAA